MQDLLLASIAAIGWGLGYFVLSYCSDVNYFTIQIVQNSTTTLLSMLAVVVQFYCFRSSLVTSNNNDDNQIQAETTVLDVLYNQLNPTKVGLLIVYSLLMFASGTCYLVGYTTTERPTLVTIVSSQYVLVSVILAIVFRNELAKYNIAYFVSGLVCCLVGTILITASKR
jgi:glucose uptake protein GlcU